VVFAFMGLKAEQEKGKTASGLAFLTIKYRED
jgi:hypothetical protein